MSGLPLRRLCAVLDLREELRLDPDALVRDPFRVWLRLADQGLQPLLQVGGRAFVESTVDLACVDQILALAAADIDAIPLAFVQRVAGDC